MKLNFKIKKIGLGLSAIMAVISLFISPSVALAESPILVIKHLASTGGSYDSGATLKSGDSVWIYTEVHNTVVGTTADNVHIKVALPSSSGSSIAYVSADNAGTATGLVNLTVNGGGTLKYVPGSTKMTWNVDGVGGNEYDNAQMPDGIVDGGLTLGSGLNGCYPYVAQITFEAVVEGRIINNDGQIKVVKYNDRNGNGTRESGEEGLPWNFAVQGPNSNNFNMTTGSDGTVTRTVGAGSYVITEESKTGWTATTGASKTVAVAAGGTSEVVFGNKQTETTTNTGTGGGTTIVNNNNNHNENKNENHINITNTNSGTTAVTTASVPTKLPATGADVLGLATMFGAAPLGVVMSRYGRGRLIVKKKDEDLNSIANDLVKTRNGQA